jgi:translation initiation factor 4G
MVTAAGKVEVVPAREQHVPFVAWVMMAAARSHLERGVWDFYIDRTEQDCLRYLEVLATTETWHLGHIGNFIVAEVDGTPAAALSGYFEAECGMPALVEGIAETNEKTGRTLEEDAAGWQRAGSFLRCSVDHVPGTWIVEWVATRPEFRRRGLIDRLMVDMLDIGRSKGATTADIGVLMENDAAQKAYEKAGFVVVQESRDAEFEAVYRCPGVRLLRREI